MRVQLQERVNELQEVRASPAVPAVSPHPVTGPRPSPLLALLCPYLPPAWAAWLTHGAFSLTAGSPGG